MSSATLLARQAREGAEGACAHCSLPVPAHRARPEGESAYCCDGCEAVSAALREHGLERWYELRDRMPGEARPARTTRRTYEEFDDESMLERCVPCEGGLATVDLVLEGVHCAACLWLVERLPKLVPGVVESRLDVARAHARITFDPARVRLSQVARTLDSLGYPPHPWRREERDAARKREDRRLALRFGVAGACAANAMTLAAALYAGALTDMDSTTTQVLRLLSLVVSLPAALWAAAPFYRGALASLRTRVLHVDLPLSLAIVAAFAGSTWHALLGSGEIYFDSLTALVFLLLGARVLQRKAARKAENASDLLAALRPSSAWRVEEGTAREVPVESLRQGDLVEVRAGDTLPADGLVEEGRSALDLSLLSGESKPCDVAPGDLVHAGTLNLNARLRVRVQGTGEATRLGRLAALVQEAALRRAPVLRLVDRLAGPFVAIVLGLTALTLAIWWPISPQRALENALAMLIVTCPCVLAFATPLSVHAALGRAARRGLLVKGGDVLESLRRPGIAVLDKTGTLTRGRMSLEAWHGDAGARPLVRALEEQSAHPLARAIAEGLAADGAAADLAVTDVLQVQGAGIAGNVASRSVAVGSRGFLASRLGEPAPAWTDAAFDAIAREGMSPVGVAVEGRLVAVAALGDRLRDDAASSIEALRARGWEIRVLSGDEPATVAALARKLGLPADAARGGVSPEAKVEAVRELKRRGPVLMAGDGVNDAAALATADVGLAVHGGAEASLAAADAFTMRPGLAPLVELVDGARSLSRALRVNACISVGYNALGAALCLAGLVSPLAAAILMPLSSLTVTAVALSWRTFPQGAATWK